MRIQVTLISKLVLKRLKMRIGSYWAIPGSTFLWPTHRSDILWCLIISNKSFLVCIILVHVSIFILFVQVANLAVMAYFFAALFSRQYLIPHSDDPNFDKTFPNSTVTYNGQPPFNKHTPDLIFPFFTIIELICYMGWIQVATSLLNPFGGEFII